MRYFDLVCPLRTDGSRDPGVDYRHIPDSPRMRHLLRGPVEAFRLHGEAARHLLVGPLHRENSLFHELAARTDLFLCHAVVNASRRLYFDEQRNALKRGSAQTQRLPGTIRRFVDVLQQLDLTYDLHSLTAERVVELLPPEFDPWRAP